MFVLTPHDLVRIAALAGCDPRTVKRAISSDDRKKSHSTTVARVKKAAVDLGYIAASKDSSL